ncbi:MAG: cytochrome c peroxidase [Woeseia sp.]
MKTIHIAMLASLLMGATTQAQNPLGLPDVPIPENNPQSAEKIALGEKLFDDERFSSTGDVSCATCHDKEKAFSDGPLVTSEGIRKLTGTRNGPTVVNSAYYESLFWDGRSPSLEDQALHPFINPIEMGLSDHEPILATIRDDREYVRAFRDVFDVRANDITMEHVTMAIAAFERTLISGDSPWDRWYFGGEEDAISESAKRGFDVFLKDGRCVSCHMIEQDFATFTDNQFHNIGVGINAMQDRVPELAAAFMQAKQQGIDVDVAVLTDADTSDLGRFAVDDQLDSMGAFKTSTLRNIAVTGPFMHDGSIATLREVVEHYNNGGATTPEEEINAFLSGGIRPLDLTDEQIDDLVAFMEALTSPQFAELATMLSTASNSGGDQ